ncbi:MAG: ATP-binding cassette domain-containing protein [Chloroflexota bacterium]
MVASPGPEHVADGSGPLLSLLHISRRFGATQALDDVSLEVGSGELRGLVGENGAGKSTLMKVLSGAIAPDAGTIVIDGTTTDRLSPHRARELGISIVYQDADLVSSLSVAENVFLGSERTNRLGVVRRDDQVRDTGRVIDELGIDLDPEMPAERLSAAERQLTQIVRALRSRPRVLVMDEPTTSLGRGEVRQLLSTLRDLAARGIAIIFISHALDEVLSVAHRVTVLKDGHVVTTREAAGLSSAELATLMVGREASAFFIKDQVPIGEVLLRVTDLAGPGIEAPVSFELRAGEVLGFGGLVGAGRTELMRRRSSA